MEIISVKVGFSFKIDIFKLCFFDFLRPANLKSEGC